MRTKLLRVIEFTDDALSIGPSFLGVLTSLSKVTERKALFTPKRTLIIFQNPVDVRPVPAPTQ